MNAEKKLYRSGDSLLGGVCKGIAEYFNIDTIIVQILTVVFTLITGGLLGVAYIALWIVLPRRPELPAPVDVQAHEVHSETYDSTRTQAPKSFVQENTQQEGTPPTSGADYGFFPVAPPEPDEQIKKDESPGNGVLWLGLILLFIGVSALLGTFVDGVEWWQFWPLLFVIGGIGQMVIPGKKGRRMSKFVGGLIQFCFGASALPFALGLYSVQSLELIFTNLWPVLLIICGLFILGEALRAPLIILLAGLTVATFCIVALSLFAIPGSTDLITLTLPTGKQYFFP